MRSFSALILAVLLSGVVAGCSCSSKRYEMPEQPTPPPQGEPTSEAGEDPASGVGIPVPPPRGGG